MTLRLTIDRRRWLDHVEAERTALGDAGRLVPVVKGNGYGVGREALAALAAEWSDLLAVGTVHEALAHTWRGDETLLVLTPLVRPVALPARVVPIVGGLHHLEVLGDHDGPVALKLLSSMSRYGCDRDDLADLCRAVQTAGHSVHSAVLHLPLTGAARDLSAQVAEIEAWLPVLDAEQTLADVPLSVSHLDPATFAALAARHPHRRFELRSGTALWHGDKSFLHLGADVVDVRPVAAGTAVGYRGSIVPDDGWLVMVGAGSTHGIATLPDGRSPFHHQRHRLTLVEGPHMHTSMCFVPVDAPVPAVGDWVDVQRPLIAVAADEVIWR
jgi:alanine racemase